MQKKKIIDLARAKSEALGNIYSLLKLNILKSCKAKGRRQRELWKNNNSSHEQKKTLPVQHMHFLFFVHFFDVDLHDYNMKRPETSWLHVSWRKCRTCSCSLVATSIPLLIHVALPNKKGFLISCSYSPSLFFSLSFASPSPIFFFFLTWQLI